MKRPQSSLLDKSLEDVKYPTLQPDVPSKHFEYDVTHQGALDGEDAHGYIEDVCEDVTPQAVTSHQKSSDTDRLLSDARLRSALLTTRYSSTLRTPTTTPDRYVNPRTDSTNSRERSILSHHASKLTPQEKTYRRRTNRSDPFGPDLRFRPDSSYLQSSQSHQRMMRPSHTDDITMNGSPVLRRGNRSSTISGRTTTSNSSRRTRRRPSTQHETIDGRLDVPVHKSRFLESVNPESEESLHAKRIALACDIDPANKILGFAKSMYDAQDERPFMSFWPSSIPPSNPM